MSAIKITRFVESKGNNDLTRSCEWSGCIQVDLYNQVSIDCLNNGTLRLRMWHALFKGVHTCFPGTVAEAARIAGVDEGDLAAAIANPSIS